jgi:superoxide oxidase
MSQTTESIEQPALQAVPRPNGSSIALHWFTVMLVLVQFTTAWWHEGLDHHSSLAVIVLATHRSTGALIWFVALARLIWRHNFAYLPPFPPTMPRLQQTIRLLRR